MASIALNPSSEAHYQTFNCRKGRWTYTFVRHKGTFLRLANTHSKDDLVGGS